MAVPLSTACFKLLYCALLVRCITCGRVARVSRVVAQETASCKSALTESSCGSWQDQYSALHARILSGQQPARYLTVDGNTGLADRLVADVSGLALAIMTDRAFVLIDHLGRKKDPLSDMYCSPHIQWQHKPKNLDSMTKLSCLWENDNREFEAPCTFGKWSQSSLNVDFDQAFGDTEMIQIHAQNGLLNWLFKHPTYASHLNRLGLHLNNAFGCLSNFIFQAGPALQRQLPEDLLKTLSTKSVIGLQVRLGDAMLQAIDATQLDFDAIFEPWSACALAIEASLGLQHPVHWLLVTDSASLKAWVQTNFPGKALFGSSARIAHYTEGRLDSAAVDNWLLGLTDYQVISEMSHFGRSAAMRTHGGASVFTVHQEYQHLAQTDLHLYQGYSRHCDIQQPDAAFDLLSAWYGM